MGRGVSSGGGQSSLGYLFGSGEPPKSATTNNTEASQSVKVSAENSAAVAAPQSHTAVSPPAAPPADVTKQVPAGIQTAGSNYVRADGQNSGNFIRDRTSTKIQSAPGGGSSLGYLFGSDGGSTN